MPSHLDVHHTLSLHSKALLLATTLSFLPLSSSSIAADLEAGEAASAICVACHAADGSTLLPEYPSLAGQGAKYLYDQMLLIRSREREIPPHGRTARRDGR